MTTSSPLSQTRPDASPNAVPLVLRPCCPDDMRAVQAIYAHYVTTNTATFEESPPDVAEMGRRRDILVGQNLPYIVATDNGTVVGYAYASPFRQRSAYRFTVEDSIYVHPDAVGLGVGRRLLAELIVQCEGLGYRQMVAVIGDSANAASIRLHRGLGFAPAGTLNAVGFKFGRWIDSIYMQKQLGS